MFYFLVRFFLRLPFSFWSRSRKGHLFGLIYIADNVGGYALGEGDREIFSVLKKSYRISNSFYRFWIFFSKGLESNSSPLSKTGI